MAKFYYVYMLTDTATGTHHYTGCTEDLQARLAKHNAGEVPHTSKFKPWRIETAVAFTSREKAYALEPYLKHTAEEPLPNAISEFMHMICSSA